MSGLNESISSATEHADYCLKANLLHETIYWRSYFRERGFPVPSFVASDRSVATDARRIGFPVVQKARRGRYDGRGAVIMRDDRELRKLMDVPSVFEECVPVETELSVIVARGLTGETRCCLSCRCRRGSR